jgi:long-chain acyl-CoA synthetase
MYLTQGLHRAIAVRPQATATIFRDRRRTFAQLGDRVSRLAGGLQELGLAPGARICMLALNSDRYLEYYLGTYWGGFCVNPANVRWTAPEIAYSLDDSETTVCIVDDQFVPMVPALRERCRALRFVIYAGEGTTPGDMLSFEDLIARTAPVVDAMRRGEDMAGVFYTGGTTGFPKGVMLSHLGLATNALSVLAEGMVAEGAKGLHAAPMFHLADGCFMNALLMRGATHVFIPSFTPVGVLETIQRERITDSLLVPTMIQMTVDHPEAANYDLTSLKNLMYGGSAISEAVIERATTRLPATKFYQAYGMTELSPCATFLGPEYHSTEGRKRGKALSGGRPVTSAEVRIVDDADNEVPRGQVGEVIVRGPGVMLGYWNKPEETRTALRNGWMHTGDGARMDDEGFVFIVDRMKDMIVSGGENVYSLEVENVLQKHSAVASCAVIGIPDDTWGEAVHAVLVLKPGASVSAEQIQDHCKGLIASYKCPRSVEFIGALPISGAGKVLKAKLRAPYWEGRERRIA